MSFSAVDGGYTEWTISACSKTCGPGYKTFERTCTNPPPSNGGKNCDDLGTAMKLVPCNEQECRKFFDRADYCYAIRTFEIIVYSSWGGQSFALASIFPPIACTIQR